MWQEAISYLQQIPLKDPGYLDAQNLLADYRANLAEVIAQKQAEIDSVQAFESAQSKIVNLPTEVNSINKDSTIGQIRQIIIQLKKVQPDTSVYQQATDLMISAEKKLQEIEQ